MAYNTPATKAVGDTLTASDWNTYVRDNMADLAARLLALTKVQAATSEFDTTSTSYVDITGATGNIVTTRQSTIVCICSGNIKADLVSQMTTLQGVIGGTSDAHYVFSDCVSTASDSSWKPFGYTFWKSGVAAGTITVKLQLKSSSGLMTARAIGINMFIVGIPEV